LMPGPQEPGFASFDTFLALSTDLRDSR
jgi:hypothetical protein